MELFSENNSENNYDQQGLEQKVMVVFDQVSLCFRKHSSIFELLRRDRQRELDFWALKQVSFTVKEGETVGIIGRNGSGKSTLSLVCTKVYTPDRGTIQVKGRVQLLALGVGFQKELSGRENVYISGSLLGLRTPEIRERMTEIEDFADIGDFMDEPVRTYSSGMRSRLAFAIATAIRPDILILDEVMTTGDKAFQDKAMERMKNLHDLARCAIVISHSPAQVKKLCNKVIWLDKGKIIMQGKPKEVLGAYNSFCKDPGKWVAEHPQYFEMAETQGTASV
jgi:ABC-type polysaccharide/polyol phosphate transport system ATPase subunit